MNTAPGIRVFCNSVPKSGTFLLSRAVELLGHPDFAAGRGLGRKVLNRMHLGVPPCLIHETVRRHWGRRLSGRLDPDGSDSIPVGVGSPLSVPARLVRAWLAAVPQGKHLVGHVPFSEAMDAVLRELRYKHLVILRDPRDVLVSRLHYVIKPDHPLSADFLRLSPEQRVSLVLKGGCAPLGRRTVVGLAQSYRSVLEWRGSSDCLTVRFEDLVGERGGGNSEQQRETLADICAHLGVAADRARIDAIRGRVFSSASPTFRQGRIGSWRDELGDDWRELFAGEDFSGLGYGDLDAPAVSVPGSNAAGEGERS